MKPPAALTLRLASVGYVALLVGLPLLAMLGRAFADGPAAFWTAATAPQARAAVGLTVGLSLAATALSTLAGTALALGIARKRIAGGRALDAMLDLPLALPAIVAGLTMLALYGPQGLLGGPLAAAGYPVAFTRAGILVALLFVTLPLVVRSVQPVLEALDASAEQAAWSLGASPAVAFRRVLLPALAPAIATGGTLALARSLGEFGSLVLIAGNLPFRTEVASVYVFGRVESGQPAAAAAVSTVLLAISLVLLLLLARLKREAVR